MSRHATLVCEFCHTEMRKNTLAAHVKAKHVKEVAHLTLEQWKESATCNMIELMSQFTATKRVWIHSKMYEGCFYLFGIKPTFFTEEDDHSAYIACEANMVAHGQFLEEVAEAITLRDLNAIGKPLAYTCPDMVGLQKQIQQLTAQLETERTRYDEHRAHLEKEASDLRELLAFSKDEHVTPYRVLQDQCAMLRLQAWESRQRCAQMVMDYEELEEKLKEEFADKTHSQSNELLGLYEAIEKERKTSEQLQSKFKRAVADGVEKERQKEKEAKEKKKAAKEKEKRRAKKAAKLAKKLAESDSDSDSSDSDSDSD